MIDRPGDLPTGIPMPPARESPLRYRDFVVYLVILATTALAIEMAFVAIGWQVYAVSGDPLDLGLVGLAMFLPLPILALPAGHLADRFPRRTILAGSICIDIAVAIGLLGLTQEGASVVWPFFFLAAATGVASALGSPALRALVPSLVPESILVRALAMRSVTFQTSAIIGPAVGGLLFAVSPPAVYVLAAALSTVSLVGALLLRSGRGGVMASTPDLQSVLGGVRLIRRTPVLLGAISLDLFAVLFAGAVALLPVFASDILDVGPAGLGILRAAPAIGALMSAIVLTRRPIRRRAGRTLLTVVAMYGVSIVVFGLSTMMWLSFAALAFGGAMDMVSVVLRQTILPLVTPDGLRGRVNAVEMVFVSASNELGAFESGVAAALVGAVPAVVLGGLATVVVAAVWWRKFPDLRRVDSLDELRPVAIMDTA
jgi:MFS family permease